jgi:hypothetical protein
VGLFTHFNSFTDCFDHGFLQRIARIALRLESHHLEKDIVGYVWLAARLVLILFFFGMSIVFVLFQNGIDKTP